MEIRLIKKTEIRADPAKMGALDPDGRLQILPYSFWEQFTQPEIAAFCVAKGYYCVPTAELIEWLNDRIDGRKAIEIASGSGVLAGALGVPATDNKMQTWPQIRMLYRGMRQAEVDYGPNVEEIDGMAAINKYKPDVVVAAWMTHRWDDEHPERKGNYWGVDERDILRVADYIHVGNRGVHGLKPILDIPHEEFEFPWLVSRAMNGAPNFIISYTSFQSA